MKTKPKKIKLERILQISNDIAEGMNQHSTSELKQVVLYWMNEHDKRIQENNRMQGEVRMAGLRLLASAELYQTYQTRKKGY